MSSTKQFALVDCNNFYASCEQVFNPRLEKKPLLILSNNDGCVIARPQKTKDLSFGFDPTQPQGSIRDLSHFFTHP